MTEIGYYSILISLLLSAYCGLASVVGVKRRRGELIASAENAAVAVFGLLTLSVAAMVYALATNDFQIQYVAKYTNRSLSLLYTLTALYAGQEGSLLFWSWLLSMFTTIVIFQNKRKNRELMPHVLLILSIILLFFMVIMIGVTNPFETFGYTPADGKGLNPMLQNPGMIFHPITLFLGYVGFTVPFAFAVAALITGQLGSTWITTTRKWTIFSWAFLTAGNLFGMQWAYVELGWGGYWAWDPVENASFIPWIVGTAYLHSVMIQEKRDMLKVWNIILIILTFLLTIFGTFITRSGLIASVHSFGESTLGWFFLVFLLVLLFISLGLLINRLPDLKSKNQLDSFLSRESSFLINNLLFVGIAFTVLWGTLFPIISEAVRGVKITVGVPFFNGVVSPIGIMLLLLTGVCPIISWRKTTLRKFLGKIALPLVVSGLAGAALFLYGIRSPYPLMTFTFCGFVAATIFLEFVNGAHTRHVAFAESHLKAFWNLIARNKRRYGGHIIHFGAVLIFMALAGYAFNTEKQVTVNKGESFQIKNYTLRYDGISEYPLANKHAIIATLSVFKDNRKIGIMSPEKGFFFGQEQPTTEVAIHTTLKEDLYVILAGYEKDVATFKVLVNPLVVWLWIGGGIMAFGSIIIMMPSRRKKLNYQ